MKIDPKILDELALVGVSTDVRHANQGESYVPFTPLPAACKEAVGVLVLPLDAEQLARVRAVRDGVSAGSPPLRKVSSDSVDMFDDHV